MITHTYCGESGFLVSRTDLLWWFTEEREATNGNSFEFGQKRKTIKTKEEEEDSIDMCTTQFK